jgi:HD-like signal output (HDOD) protein
MRTEKNINRIVKKIEQIPTLPIISKQIQSLFKDDNVTIQQVTEIIQADPPLTVKILKIVNSSFYGLLNNISSLDHALVILGFKEVRNIVLGFSIQKSFAQNDTSFDRKRFWKHSIVCSQVAKFLGKHFNTVDDGTFFLSGLTHDIGKLVIDQYFHEEFNSIIDYISNNRATFSKAEKEILGVTHYQIAAKLLKQWYLPNKVIMQIFYHHAPWHDNNFTAGSIIVYLSNILTKMSGYTCLEDEKQTQISDLINPSALNFINKNGFDFDQGSSEKLIKLISEFTSAEKNNVLKIFD